MNARGTWDDTALQAASSEGHYQVVQRLLEAGADMNVGSGCLRTPLVRAAIYGHEQIVQCLLEAGAILKADDIQVVRREG